MRGFLFGRWKLGEGVVLLRFLWCRFRAFFLKRFIGQSGCVVVRKVADVFGTVLRCQKGQGWTTRTEILCFLFGSHMVACSWLGGCLLWPIDMKMRYMWRDCEGTVFD